MKLIILNNHLKNGLEIINRIKTDDFNTLPILKNFLIQTINNRIQLSATNLELATTCFIPGKIIENGGTTVPISIFNNIIHNLQDERVNLECKDGKFILKTDNYQAQIQTIKKEEFPIIPKIDNSNIINNLQIPSFKFKDWLLLVISAAQNVGKQPELNSVFFDFTNNSLKLAATDSFRLAEKSIDFHQFQTSANKDFQILIPLNTIQEIIKVLKDEDEDQLSITFNSHQVFFQTKDVEIISHLINGQFPNYLPIIPQTIETEINLDKTQLIQGLKLTGVFTDKFNEVKIVIKKNSKNIELYSRHQQLGENQYLIPAKISGEPLEIVLNWRFLLDGLKTAKGENISLGFNGDSKPIIIKNPQDPSWFYILMPINIKS